MIAPQPPFRIYLFHVDVDHFSSIRLADSSKRDLARSHVKARPMLANWGLPEATFMHLGDDRNRVVPGDFAWLEPHLPAISDRACSLLLNILRPHCELLPVLCGALKYWIVNTLTVIDALAPQSRVHRFQDGRIRKIEKYVFDYARISSSSIFKLPGGEDLASYVGEELVTTATVHGLTGLAPLSVN